MRAILHDFALTERGTTRAIVNYAREMTSRYSLDVSLVAPESELNNPRVINSLSNDFEVILYSTPADLQSITRMIDPDFVYATKAGHWDGLSFGDVHTAVHAVFDRHEPHGDRYAYISQSLAQAAKRRWLMRRIADPIRRKSSQGNPEARLDRCSNAGDFAVVPRIVHLPRAQENWRERLGVPQDAFVIGSLSGRNEFNIPFVKSWLESYITKNQDVYFIGPNLKPFSQHSRMKFVDVIVNDQDKADYLSSLDAFLHAQALGETFGQALSEALFTGLPSLSWAGGRGRNHVALLRGSGWLYKNERDLERIVNRLRVDRRGFRQEARDRVQQFHPNQVMERFFRVFLPQLGERDQIARQSLQLDVAPPKDKSHDISSDPPDPTE